MSRIAQTLAKLAENQQTALIPYITSGDPTPEHTLPIMHALVKSGAHMLELGVPFSDPMADGPIIQRATERALAHQESLKKVLEKVAQFRQTNSITPVILMGYLNPVEAMGYSTFVQAAKTAGVDGVLLVDMPPEEAHPLVDELKNQGLDLIFLITPTTPDNRLAAVKKLGSGFVYYVSLKGITGAGHTQWQEVEAKVKHLQASLEMPVGVGFGIRTPEHAANVARYAQGAIIGSVVVAHIEQHQQQSPEDLAQSTGELVAQFVAAVTGE